MKYEEKFSFELLEILEKEDQGRGVGFSDHSFVRAHASDDRFLNNYDLNPRNKYHFDKLQERGFVIEVRKTDFFTDYSISEAGHQHIKEYRNNIWWRRLGRSLAVFFTTALGSILISILTTLFTILVLNYFGLSDLGSPSKP